MTEATIWGIHGGQRGEADALFLKTNVVALGWQEMGDLSAIPADRESFKSAVSATYPEAKPGWLPNAAGQVFRFVHEMNVGDLVIYPSKQDRLLHIGSITGQYVYEREGDPDFPQRRKVKWIKALPRTHFSQGALYEIGSALSLFQVKNYAEEYRTALAGTAPPPPVGEDETVSLVAEDIGETTRDFVLKKLFQELKGASAQPLRRAAVGSDGLSHARLP